MQKKIIALAVAALASSAAFAQSNVTIYGVADAGLLSAKTDGMHRSTQVISNGLATSRIGFRGTEDLGNGLKALFVLETAVNLDQASAAAGNSGLFGANRQSMVGLTGGFGTAVAGRLQTAGYDWAVKNDVLVGTAISPLQQVNAANFLIGGTALAARADNAIAYISPSFSGLTVAVNHAFVNEENAAANVAKNGLRANLVSAAYANGPLSAGLVYAKASGQPGNVTMPDLDKTDWALGAAYDFGVATVKGTYQTSKVSGTAVVAPADNKDKAYSLGVAVPVSAAGTVLASYAKNTIDSTALADNTKAYTLAYTHALSKRTTAYAGYNRINRDTNIDTTNITAGINHKF